jgi:hypothetical protein
VRKPGSIEVLDPTRRVGRQPGPRVLERHQQSVKLRHPLLGSQGLLGNWRQDATTFKTDGRRVAVETHTYRIAPFG